MEDYFSFFRQTQVVRIHHSTAHRFITHGVKPKVAKPCKSPRAAFPSSKATFCGSLTWVNKSLFSITTGTIETPWTEPTPDISDTVMNCLDNIPLNSQLSLQTHCPFCSLHTFHFPEVSKEKFWLSLESFNDFSSFLAQGQGRNVCFFCKEATHQITALLGSSSGRCRKGSNNSSISREFL